MRVRVFKSLWGMTEGGNLEGKLRLLREAGYDGVETEPPDAMKPETWRDLCARYGLSYIAAIYSLTAEAFTEQLTRAIDYGPVLINAQTGRDHLAFDDGCRYLEACLAAEARGGVPVAHETHRHRLFFTPWTTAGYLEQFPQLKICADFSHWVVVTESRLADMDEWLDIACRRAIHVHARVGHEEAPQVSDPRAPEFAEYVALFEGWWRRILHLRAEGAAAAMTVTPEYGPPKYMPTLAYTREPLANLWEVCRWGADRVRALAR